MIKHMTNGMVYTIPNGVKYANLQIAISNAQLDGAMCDIRKIEREVMFEKNKDRLIGFSWIGFENIKHPEMYIELHWFIDKIDLSRCSVRLEGDEA